MRYEILFAPEAVEDLDHLAAKVRAEVRDGVERHLRHEPTKTSRSRIKRLRGLSRPQYRLRIGDDIRVFYDVDTCSALVKIEAIGYKQGSKLFVHGEEYEL